MPGDVVSLRLLQDMLKKKNSTKLSIPFSSARGTTVMPAVDNKTGVLTETSVIGYGLNSQSSYQVKNGTDFHIPFGQDNQQYVFSLPYDVVLVAISAIFNNYTTFSIAKSTTHMSPYVAIAITQNDGTYDFKIQLDSRTYPSPGYSYRPQAYSSNTVLTTTNTTLNIPIPAGTPMAVVSGLIGLGTTFQSLGAWIYMHGSLVFEI